MDSVIVLFLYFVLAMAVLAPLQALRLNRQAHLKALSIGVDTLVRFSLCSVASGLLVGFGVGYAMMFSPSYFTGDYIGLPWLTMLPALALALLAGAKTNRIVLTKLLAHAEETRGRIELG